MSTRRDKIIHLKRKIGAELLDYPRFLWALHGPAGLGAHWTRYGNRIDRLADAPDGFGVRCNWEYSRPLYLCNHFTNAGQTLLKRALCDWPVRLQERPDHWQDDGLIWNGETKTVLGGPEVSVVIGHRGTMRLPHLLRTLESIAGQENALMECIVVEQDVAPLVRNSLPDWVRYLHISIPGPNTFFNRSRALNAGVRIARAPTLVLHDNDMLLPARHVAEHLKYHREGFDVVDLKRFVFYLAEGDWAQPSLSLGESSCRVGHIIENLRAGGSVFITREAFDAVGGMDEAFVSWGGEDVEFWQRALTRRVWNFGFLPMVHLWHPDQPGKTIEMNAAWREQTRQSLAVPPEDRIVSLLAQPRSSRK